MYSLAKISEKLLWDVNNPNVSRKSAENINLLRID